MSGSDPVQQPTAPLPFAQRSPSDPFVGAIIGDRYRLMERIGEGGMGAVYRAEHVLMKKQVALKLLHPELGSVDDAARRFEREAQSASRLSHPNIVAVTDFGRAASGELFLVMEYVPGGSLADLLDREGPLPLARALSIARQVLDGLAHAHEQGVIHRDLKPANVMVYSDPRVGDVVKILDFGIAKITQGSEGDRPLTQGAMVFGTPSYMSPEQATAQDADGRADLYSCAVLLYEMLAGRKPFIASDLVKVMAMQVTQPPPPFGAVASGRSIPSSIESVVMRALEKDRERRFPTAASFSHALDEAEHRKNLGLAHLPMALGRARDASGRFFGRMPWSVRRWVPLGGVAAVVLTLTLLPMMCTRTGQAPTATPPPPKPSPPELQIHIKRIEEAIARAQLKEAKLLLMQQLSKHPRVGRVRYLLGNLAFAEGNPADGLEAYGKALELDPGLRADEALLLNIQRALPDKRLGRDALDMLIEKVGKPAGAILAELASEDRRMEFRKDAREACDRLGCAGKVDLVSSYGLDLAQGKSCEERREVVDKLVATKDARAIDPLKKARRSAFGLNAFLGGGNSCMRRELDAAIKELGESGS